MKCSVSFLLFLAGVFLFISFCSRKYTYRYPETPEKPVYDTIHGVVLEDPYRFLEDSESPFVKEWTKKQNILTLRIIRNLPFREELKKRIENLWNYPRMSVPVRYGNRYFYLRNDGLQNQSVLCVREGIDGKEKVLIDPNSLSDKGIISLDWWYPSEDGKYVAYGLSVGGNELSTLHIIDVNRGINLPDTIPNCRFSSVAWRKDSRGFYYTRFPKPGTVPEGDINYYHKVCFHQLGENPDTDPIIFERPDKKEIVFEIDLSNDGRYLMIYSFIGASTVNEVYYVDTKSPNGEVVQLVKGFDYHYSGKVVDGQFFIITNRDAPRYKVMIADMKNPQIENWKTLISESDDIIKSLTITKNGLVINYMHNAYSRIALFSRDGEYEGKIDLPGIGSVRGISGRWNSNQVFFAFESYNCPPIIYEFNTTTKKKKTFFKTPVKVDTSAFVVKQEWYRSKDGTKISMFIVHKKGLRKNGKNPTILYGYGGFNISITPSFVNYMIAWLERGGVYAAANLRGGGEYGEKWHRMGMKENKQNVFDDFIAAAEYLIQSGYTSPRHLGIMGGSNGGLLAGAVLTQRPDLFKAVVCAVPLLDMIRYHKFLIARYWIPEYGSSDDLEQFEYLLKYSPYHNVRIGEKYPAVLITTAENDTRVHPMHARKMAALLQKANVSSNPILLYVEQEAGHGQGKPVSKRIENVADQLTFFLWQLK